MRKLCLAAAVGLGFVGAVLADTITSPYAKGGVISIVETDTYKRYVHTFTNTAEAATFRNKSSRTLHARILVVGAGGAGGFGLQSSSGGGGGGGGGGVFEAKGVQLSANGSWTIRVGKGATATTNTGSPKNVTAGSSSISNGTECVAEVPGGGNGGESTSSGEIEKGHAATPGAAGGGGLRAVPAGAEGTFRSSILGVEYGPFAGGTVLYNHGYTAGGGGAGAAGAYQNGGAGLASDITGVSLVYGSGGGGGGSVSSTGETIYAAGVGGPRAGTGASGTYDNQEFNLVGATSPEPNSGCGGAGGLGGNVNATLKGTIRYGTSGADGIVVIAYEIMKIPFVGGEVTKIAEQGKTATYIHVFTNVNDVATFENVSGDDISVRLLVVGAGGAGGYGLKSASGSGGGGGGGGVFDAENITMPAEGTWTIRVGKGARATASTGNPRNDTAGASSISNGTACVALVPGGGNGAESTASSSISADGHEATAGAAGGGGIRGSKNGAAGTYASSILGVEYGPFAGGNSTNNYRGGGGGGAGEAGTNPNGGEGLVSDITGESLVYGSGGGSGGNQLSDGKSHYEPGIGGTRAGTGANAVFVDDVPVTTLATAPAANSGCGGAGGVGGTINGYSGIDTKVRFGTSGADGIVVIRYDWTYDPNPPVPGLMLIVR